MGLNPHPPGKLYLSPDQLGNGQIQPQEHQLARVRLLIPLVLPLWLLVFPILG